MVNLKDFPERWCILWVGVIFFDSDIFAKKHKKVNRGNSMGKKSEKGSKMD